MAKLVIVNYTPDWVKPETVVHATAPKWAIIRSCFKRVGKQEAKKYDQGNVISPCPPFLQAEVASPCQHPSKPRNLSRTLAYRSEALSRENQQLGGWLRADPRDLHFIRKGNSRCSAKPLPTWVRLAPKLWSKSLSMPAICSQACQAL